MMKNTCIIQRIGWGLLSVFWCTGVAYGQAFSLDMNAISTNEVLITHPGTSTVYYQMLTADVVTNEHWMVTNMMLGGETPLSWRDDPSSLSQRFYRVRAIPVDKPFDEDADGLDDVSELQIGSEPLNRDTDNDGMRDGDEFQQGFDVMVSNVASEISIRYPSDGRMLP